MISILETGLSRSSIYSVDYVIFHSAEVAAKFHDILIHIVLAINLTVALPCNTSLSVNRLVISSYLTNSYRKINTKARAALFLLFFICIFSGNPNWIPLWQLLTK